jgi:aminoglycoside phosphotransferase (APT) family kinase protein
VEKRQLGGMLYFFLIYILSGLCMPLFSNKTTEAIEIVQNILKKKGPFSVDILSGGLSDSTIVKVNASSQSYVVRFWNMQWAEYFPQDLACQMIASEAGYGPHVFFASHEEGFSVIEYFQPEAFPSVESRLQAYVDLLKKMHHGPMVPRGIDKSIDLDESIEDAIKINPQFIDLKVIKTVKDAVFKALPLNISPVPCHRDLHPGNLIYNQGRFVAIDYTWCGMDDPFSDLATIAIFNCQTPKEEELLLQLYHGHAPTLRDIAHLISYETIFQNLLWFSLFKIGI